MSADQRFPRDTYEIIEAYGTERFRISGKVYQHSVIVFPERTIPWSVKRFEDIGPTDFMPVMEATESIEILLLGCGNRMRLVTHELRGRLRAAGVVIEPMDTGAAARTFNLLLSEDRRVAAAMIALY